VRPTGVGPATYGSVELLTTKSYVNYTSFSFFSLWPIMTNNNIFRKYLKIITGKNEKSCNSG
jgi:hypothetical protein